MIISIIKDKVITFKNYDLKLIVESEKAPRLNFDNTGNFDTKGLEQNFEKFFVSPLPILNCLFPSMESHVNRFGYYLSPDIGHMYVI